MKTKFIAGIPFLDFGSDGEDNRHPLELRALAIFFDAATAWEGREVFVGAVADRGCKMLKNALTSDQLAKTGDAFFGNSVPRDESGPSVSKHSEVAGEAGDLFGEVLESGEAPLPNACDNGLFHGLPNT